MEKFKFNPPLSEKENWDKALSVFLILIALGFLIFLFGGFETKYDKLIYQIIPYLLILIPAINAYWHKNYVWWNRYQMNIRINSRFKTTTIRFGYIQEMKFSENEFEIKVYPNNTYVLDLKNIDVESKQRLRAIFEKRAFEGVLITKAI